MSTSVSVCLVVSWVRESQGNPNGSDGTSSTLHDKALASSPGRLGETATGGVVVVGGGGVVVVGGGAGGGPGDGGG